MATAKKRSASGPVKQGDAVAPEGPPAIGQAGSDAPPSEAQPEADEARIRERAYHIWVEEGRPEGRDVEHWLRARDAEKTGENQD